MIVHSSLRFELGPEGIRAVRKGDLEVSVWPFSPDLELHTEIHPGRIVTDDQDRILLETDEIGKPLRRDGRFVPIVADRWLILEAGGRRAEIPLLDGPTNK